MSVWLQQHRQAIGQAIAALAAQPLGSLLSALVLGIALALPASGLVLLENLARLGRGVSGQPEIGLYLADQLPATSSAALTEQLGRHPDLSAVRFVPRDEALERFKAAGMADLIAELPANPLPDAIMVTPRDQSYGRIETLRGELAALPGVIHVQANTDWLRKLDALLQVGRYAVLTLAVLLGATLVIVTFNTIRLQLLSRRPEIELSQLLGASAQYVRRPYYWFGIVQGLLGGLIALGAVFAVIEVLRGPLATLAEAYGMPLRLAGPAVLEVLLIIGFAALLGWLGSALAVRRHIQVG